MSSIYVKEKRTLKGIRGMLLAITVINVALTLILSYAASFFEASVTATCLQALIVAFGAYIVPIMIYAHRNGITANAAKDRFCLKSCPISVIITAALFGAGCQFVQIAISLPFNAILGGSSSFMPATIWELFISVIVIAIIPAVFEEFLFRGIVYCSMAELNTAAATVFSAFMFAVMHADLYGFLGYLIMGLALAFLTRHTKSLYGAMVFHFANNLTALLLAFFNEKLWYMPETMILLFAAGLTLFAASFYSIPKLCGNTSRKKISKNHTSYDKDALDATDNTSLSLSSRKVKCSTLLGQSFINLSVILCILLTIGAGIIVKII